LHAAPGAPGAGVLTMIGRRSRSPEDAGTAYGQERLLGTPGGSRLMGFRPPGSYRARTRRARCCASKGRGSEARAPRRYGGVAEALGGTAGALAEAERPAVPTGFPRDKTFEFWAPGDRPRLCAEVCRPTRFHAFVHLLAAPAGSGPILEQKEDRPAVNPPVGASDGPSTPAPSPAEGADEGARACGSTLESPEGGPTDPSRAPHRRSFAPAGRARGIGGGGAGAPGGSRCGGLAAWTRARSWAPRRVAARSHVSAAERRRRGAAQWAHGHFGDARGPRGAGGVNPNPSTWTRGGSPQSLKMVCVSPTRPTRPDVQQTDWATSSIRRREGPSCSPSTLELDHGTSTFRGRAGRGHGKFHAARPGEWCEGKGDP